MTAFSRLRAEKNVDTEDNITSAVPLINTDKLFSKYEKNEFDFQPLQTETEIPTKKISASAFSNLRKEKEPSFINVNEELQDNSFLTDAGNAIQDIVTQPFGGLVDASESLINLALPEEKEIQISYLVPEAKTSVGRFVRPASQFFIPYTGAFKIAKGGYLFIKNAKNLNKAIKTAEKNLKKKKPTTLDIKSQPGDKLISGYGLFKKQKKLTRLENLGIGGGASVITDAFAFAPYDANLADLMVRYPATKNAVTEWLQTNPNGDPGMERLKNALTGVIPGFIIPEVLRGVGKGFTWSTKPARSKLKKIADEVEIREELEVNRKKAELGENAEVNEIRKLQSKKRNYYESVAMAFRKGQATQKAVINYLDGIKGIKYLMDAATKVGVKGLTGKNKIGAYKEARFLPAVGGMVEHFLLKGTFRFKDGMMVSTGNDGLQNIILKNLGKNADVDDFFDYMGAKSLLSLDDDAFKGLFKDTAKKKKQFQDIAKKGDVKENYVRTLKEMDRFNSELLDFAVDTQMITKTQKALFLEKRKHYLPLYRDISDTELLLKRAGGSNKLRAPLKAKVPVGTGKGELPFSNFFDNYVENIQSIISTGYKNHVKRATFDIIDEAKIQGKSLEAWAKKLEGKDGVNINKVNVKGEELKRILNKAEIEFNPNQLDDIDDLALFRAERIDVGDNEYVFRTVVGKDGVEKTVKDVYQINDDLLKLTLDHISPKQYHQVHAFIKLARGFKNLLTRMVTLDPGFFAGANALRDTFSAAILSSRPFHLPILSSIRSVFKRMTNTKAIKMEDGSFMSTRKLYEEFILNGGSFGSTLLRGEISEGILKTLYRKMGHSDYKNVLNTPKKAYDGYESIVTGFENASRFTEYRLLRQAGVSAREAAFQAREVAVDFGMHGANQFFRQYVSTVPFLNAGLQGIYRTVRAFKGTSNAEKALVTTKIMAYVGLPTMTLYAMNRNNPDYWNLSQQIRDTNYMIPLDGGNWIKIPKPFEFGAVGTIMEAALSEFDDNENVKADAFYLTMWTVLKDQLRLSVTPQVVSPIWNAYMNKTFFGSPVVPEGMRHTLPDYGQSYPWSNKIITSVIEAQPDYIRDKLMSPIEFENYIRAYTGTIGGFVLDIMDETSDLFSNTKRPDMRLDEFPWLKRFLSLEPAKYTRAEAEFYELKKKASQAINQYRKFKDEFKTEALKDFLDNKENQELLALSPRLERWGSIISNLNAQRNQIYNTPNMSGAKKRELLNMIERKSGKIFDKIMNELEGKNLDVLDDTIFE